MSHCKKGPKNRFNFLLPYFLLLFCAEDDLTVPLQPSSHEFLTSSLYYYPIYYRNTKGQTDSNHSSIFILSACILWLCLSRYCVFSWKRVLRINPWGGILQARHIFRWICPFMYTRQKGEGLQTASGRDCRPGCWNEPRIKIRFV